MGAVGGGLLLTHLRRTITEGQTLTRGRESCKDRTQSPGLNARPWTRPGN